MSSQVDLLCRGDPGFPAIQVYPRLNGTSHQAATTRVDSDAVGSILRGQPRAAGKTIADPAAAPAVPVGFEPASEYRVRVVRKKLLRTVDVSLGYSDCYACPVLLQMAYPAQEMALQRPQPPAWSGIQPPRRPSWDGMSNRAVAFCPAPRHKWRISSLINFLFDQVKHGLPRCIATPPPGPANLQPQNTTDATTGKHPR